MGELHKTMDDHYFPTCEDDSCRIERIEMDLHDIKETLELIKTTMLKADSTIATIAGEVKPTLDALTTNPMVKMFLNKGK